MMLKLKKKKKTTLYLKDDFLIVSGKLGKIKHKLPSQYIIKEKSDCLFIKKEQFNSFLKLIKKLLKSVDKGFQRQIEIKGKGFKLIKYKNYLSFDLGYSNLFLYKNTNKTIKAHQTKYKLTLFSINLELLNKILYTIKSFYYHDKYHNKGISIPKSKKVVFKKLM